MRILQAVLIVFLLPLAVQAQGSFSHASTIKHMVWVIGSATAGDDFKSDWEFSDTAATVALSPIVEAEDPPAEAAAGGSTSALRSFASATIDASYILASAAIVTADSTKTAKSDVAALTEQWDLWSATTTGTRTGTIVFSDQYQSGLLNIGSSITAYAASTRIKMTRVSDGWEATGIRWYLDQNGIKRSEPIDDWYPKCVATYTTTFGVTQNTAYITRIVIDVSAEANATWGTGGSELGVMSQSAQVSLGW